MFMGMKNNKGISIVLVMGVLVILGILATVFITMSIREVRISSLTSNSKIAFHAAEAGLDFGIAGIPASVSAFPALPDTWTVLTNQAKYKSGLPDTIPTPPVQTGQGYMAGYSIEENAKFVGLDYSIVTSGQMRESERVVEAGIRCGPMPGGTRY